MAKVAAVAIGVAEITYIEQLPLAKLRIDPKYSREPNRSWVKRLAAGWDDQKAGVIFVSLRDGDTYVVDGWHRVQAALDAKLKHLRALAFDGLNQTEEAELFAGLNASRPPTRMQAFKAALAAEDTDAVAIYQTVRKYGLHIGFEGQPKGASSIQAVGSLQYIFNRFGLTVFEAMLEVVTRAWPNGEGERFNGHVLKGVGIFLGAYPTADIGRVQRVLQHQTPGFVIGRAKVKQAAEVHKGDIARGCARVLLDLYNEHLSKNRLPDWQGKVRTV